VEVVVKLEEEEQHIFILINYLKNLFLTIARSNLEIKMIRTLNLPIITHRYHLHDLQPRDCDRIHTGLRIDPAFGHSFDRFDQDHVGQAAVEFSSPFLSFRGYLNELEGIKEYD
jgi:hypothetical protein